MCDMRENVWTQMARVLNKLCAHQISKRNAYLEISGLFETCTPEEIEEMVKYREESSKPHDLGDLLKSRSEEKVNTFRLGLKDVEK